MFFRRSKFAWRRPHLLLYTPARVRTKRPLLLSGLCQWYGAGRSRMMEPLGNFWYKTGDPGDGRDWLQASFFIKYAK
jgi:hypothetical protein